jgi:hypothetical protein
MPVDLVIDGRARAAIFADLLARAPGYVPEWTRLDDTPAYALLSILARDVEIQAAAENGMPDRSRLAFLSTLGNGLLSAQAAGTPLVFQLMPNAPLDVTLNGGSQVAAVLPPPPPSLLGAPATTTGAPIFSTDETITLTRATLTTLYSVDPDSDTYADHSASQTAGFAFFDAMQPVPHQLYLGHDAMFRLPSSAEIQLSFDLAAAYAQSTARPLLLDWEYLSTDGWLPLRIGGDTTARLTRDGQVVLWLDCGPDAQQSTIAGISSYWIRATVSSRIPSGLIGPLPGGYQITWSPVAALTSVAPAPAPLVTLGGPYAVRVVTVVQSTLTLGSALPGAKAGLPLLIREWMTVTAGQGTTAWTVVRAASDTAAVAHAKNSGVSYFAGTTLLTGGGIDAAATSMAVASAAGFPTAGDFTIMVENEAMTVTGGQGTTNWTVTRGVNGTTALAHAQNTAISYSASTTLAASIDNSATLLTVAAIGGFPGSGNFALAVDTNVGLIADIVGGQSLTLDGVNTSRTITIDGLRTATVLGAGGNVAVLDQPLADVLAKGLTPTLTDVQTGAPLGQLATVNPDFFVPLDSGAEFLVDDIVTVDGSTEAAVKAPQAQGVTLVAPIQNATPGNQLVLANALPVLRPEGADASGVLPAVDTIFARVGFTKSGLSPEAAFCDTAPLDTTNTFYPFGKLPQQFTTFYLASDEVFARQNAQVAITFRMAQPGVGYSSDGSSQGVGPNLLNVSIEYFGANGWNAMGPAQALVDATMSLTGTSGPMTISFICPLDWQATQVNGQSKYWLRLRIDGGNYGHPLQLSVDPGPPPTVVSSPATLMPPVVATVSLQYTFLTNAALVQHCLTYNDFVFADHSEDVQWPRRWFQPFTPVGDLQPAIHFGFSQKLPAGLVSLYFAADPTGAVAAPTGSPFVWEYASPRGWVGLSTLDGTDGFSSSGFVQFIGPPDTSAIAGLGGSLNWIRARLKPDIPPTALPGLALWLNAVEAHQAMSVQDGTLGSSDGNPGQSFAFPPQNVPVLPGEIIQVREWTGRGDDWQTTVQGVPQADLEMIVDPTDGVTVIEVWVTWQNVPFFYSSASSDRVYMLERATGLLEFPTPPFGMIPPAGALITATYSTGGGLAGNVPAGTITELHSGASYVQSVTNPFAASGGSATEGVSRAQGRATQRIRNRLRAVASADFEWIAREASPEVARARCLSTTGPDGSRELGWVTLVVVPNSTDPAPMPSAGLLAEVEAALIACVPATIAGSILLQSPTYTALSVRADIAPLQPDQAALVEARVRDRLASFLHPLLGGAKGDGWDFGEPVYQSQVATLLEATEGVDYVALLQLLVNDGVVGDVATIPAGALVTQGDHQLKLVVEEG